MASRMKVFVDTSALLAVLDAKDPNHDAATTMLEAVLQDHEPFTHNYIQVEAEQLVRRLRSIRTSNAKASCGQRSRRDTRSARRRRRTAR